MPDLRIPQAVVVLDAGGPSVVAKSDAFPFAWEDAAQTAAVRFGRRPPGVRCPAAVFAVPLGRAHVAVVSVTDLPARSGSEGQPPLGFRFLILPRNLYEALGDPFAIADRFPPDWSARGHLPTLEWPPEPLPRRTVEGLQGLLRSAGDDTSLLLGGAQALLDGGRLMLVSAAPADAALRGLWQFLPDRTRCELWPATFAFSNELGFHAVALPGPPAPWPVGYLTADQARDYPEGRYELAVQTAVESGNQPELDRLLARRSSQDTLRLALYMLAAAMLIAVASKVLL